MLSRRGVAHGSRVYAMGAHAHDLLVRREWALRLHKRPGLTQDNRHLRAFLMIRHSFTTATLGIALLIGGGFAHAQSSSGTSGSTASGASNSGATSSSAQSNSPTQTSPSTSSPSSSYPSTTSPSATRPSTSRANPST